MPWPASSVATGDVVTASQLNLLPIQIADSTLSASAASFDFTSLPGQFAHLMIVVSARGDTAALTTALQMRLNNYSNAGGYVYVLLSGQNNAASSAATTSATLGVVGDICAASTGSGLFSSCAIIIPSYAAVATKQWTAQSFAVSDGTAANMVLREAGGYTNLGAAAAVTRVTLFPAAGNFVSGSRATIYGLA